GYRAPDNTSGAKLARACETPSSFHRLPAQMPIEQLFGELHALELQQLGILFQMTIQGHADLPGSREHLRVLDRGFVQHGIGSDERVAFDHVQAVAREIPRAVEPRLAVEAGQSTTSVSPSQRP